MSRTEENQRKLATVDKQLSIIRENVSAVDNRMFGELRDFAKLLKAKAEAMEMEGPLYVAKLEVATSKEKLHKLIMLESLFTEFMDSKRLVRSLMEPEEIRGLIAKEIHTVKHQEETALLFIESMEEVLNSKSAEQKEVE